MKYNVVHSMRGRLRLRVPALRRDKYVVAGCLAELNRHEGVILVSWNEGCASLAIQFEAARCGAQCLLDLITRGSFRNWRSAGKASISAQATTAEVTTAGATTAEATTGTGGLPIPIDFDKEESSLLKPAISLALLFLGPAGLVFNIPLILYNALPTCNSALRVVRKEHRLNVDFLDGMAIAIALSMADFATTAVMIMLIRTGNWIREHTAGRSRRAIGELLDYQGRNAWLLTENGVARVPAKSLAAGNKVMVYPGELIPVDGEVLRGSATIDQKTITGESLPVRRGQGESVYASTVVREGKLLVDAKRVGAGTTAAQIVHLVEQAPIGETRIQNYAERFADKLVAPQLLLNCGLFALTGNVNRFLSMTIIDYGTGIRVAAPTSVLASMTHAARQGIVIRSGSHVEKLSKIDTLVFDKTGTLTAGTPEIKGVKSYSTNHFPEWKILALAAAAEERLAHPVARALVAEAQARQIEIPRRSESHYEIGMGVTARINGYFVHVGSEKFLSGRGIRSSAVNGDLKDIGENGWSPLLVAVDDDVIGVIPYADSIRPESAAVVRSLYEKRRVRKTVMLTGDNGTVARAVARQLGIEQFVANTMPSEKADIVRDLQRSGATVAMVGDGINDSPALAWADVGIAMKNGADVAQESADVVLMEDNLWKLVQAIDISKKSMALIRQNYTIIAGVNTLALLLALPAGLVSPNLTALMSNGSAVLATLNAIRPILRY